MNCEWIVHKYMGLIYSIFYPQFVTVYPKQLPTVIQELFYVDFRDY